MAKAAEVDVGSDQSPMMLNPRKEDRAEKGKSNAIRIPMRLVEAPRRRGSRTGGL
jgi:hypothetical protein